MKNFFDKYLIILWIITSIGLVLFLGHCSNILIDIGREVFYPEQILSGKLLFKDIFNIYGALAYQINAILYAIFKTNLTSLYISGAACSFLLVTGIYLISKEFLSKFLSFAVAFFAISIGIFSTSLFNFHFPYSWAILYGIISFVFSVLFLVRFIKTNRSELLCISAFLAGVCVALKYDFILYSFVILFFIVKNKNLKALLSFFLTPLISFGILFVQGLRLTDILNTLNTYSLMAKSETLKYFYQNSGVYFHVKSLPLNLILFLKFAVPFSGIVFGVWIFNKKRILSIFLTIISSVVLVLLFSKNYVFGFLPILTLILTLSLIKKLDTKSIILSISVLSISVKVFWVLLLGSYGNFYAALLILACLSIIFNVLPKINDKAVGIVLIGLSSIFLTNGLFDLKNVSQKITSDKGTIYTTQEIANSSDELIKFLKDNNKKDAVIFPEGLIINFLSNTKSDDYFNSLLPLYIETFGEKNIVKHFENTMPEYIILSNLDMKDYYFRYICNDYAFEFCEFVNRNYKPVKTIDNDFRYIIFEKL